mgnify:CR=1 FL=1
METIIQAKKALGIIDDNHPEWMICEKCGCEMPYQKSGICWICEQEESIISRYTREQALEDGVLVDLNQYIPVHESGFKFPLACTSSVYGIIEKAVNNEKYCNDYKGVVWDIFWMLKLRVRPGNEIIFKVIKPNKKSIKK